MSVKPKDKIQIQFVGEAASPRVIRDSPSPVQPFWFILVESDIRVRSNRLNPQRSIGTGSIREQTISSWHTPLSRQRI